MELRIGEPIDLATKYGPVLVRHVNYKGKEGVCLTAHEMVSDDKLIPVRVQSSCLFSESFWATDCDCAAQLLRALEVIIEEGGVLIYFYEEGRGAGLEAKIEAIRLQQTANMNTFQAYECLQLQPDIRSYEAVGKILGTLLPVGRRIALLTNNPRKERLIREAGVDVALRRPLVCKSDNPQTRRYLEEKVRVLGHKIEF